MYIHRIIIDANCINAKGRLDAMNELESYHSAGLVEILKTTTLDAEFRTAPLRKAKGKKYLTIGGAGVAQMGNDRAPDAMPGAVTGDSQFYHYYIEIFGEHKTGADRRRSLRDCLHIDQAILNNSDYFVTYERALIEGGKKVEAIRNNIEILTPEACLKTIQNYFKNNYGTCRADDLVTRLNSAGPVILGSNTTFGFSIQDPTNGDVLLSSFIKDGSLVIEVQVRNEDGDLILDIVEGKKTEFHSNGASVRLMGHGPLVVGENSCNQMCIGKAGYAYLAVRAISSGRVLFHRVNLTSRDGQRKITIKGEMMELKGLSIGPPQNPL
jgi:hypothetical protein